MLTLTSQLLHATADLLAEPGVWMQGGYGRREDGQVIDEPTSEELATAPCLCTWSALNRAAADIPALHRERVRYAAEKALVREVGNSIPAWNDDPDRTLDEVLDTLRQVASRC